MKNGICAYEPCSRPFRGYSNKRYCSSTCRTYASHGKTTIPGWRERASLRNAPKTRIYIKLCPITNQLFVTKNANYKYHSDAFITSSTGKSKYIFKAVERIPHVCAKCGLQSMVSNKTKSKYCISCYNKEWRRMNKHLRRAAKRGNSIEFITPYIVFERDEWTCKRCGISTPKDLRGTIQWNAPELDHVIPISKGGSHTMDNLQCLCRRCNNSKGDKVYRDVG